MKLTRWSLSCVGNLKILSRQNHEIYAKETYTQGVEPALTFQSYELPFGSWELNLGPPEEQPVLLLLTHLLGPCFCFLTHFLKISLGGDVARAKDRYGGLGN